MTAQERIARLQALLARVTTRAAAPRLANGAEVLAAPEPVGVADAPDETVVSFDEAPIDIEVSDLTEEAPPVVEVIAPEPSHASGDVAGAAEPQRSPMPVEIESRERIIAAPVQPLPQEEPQEEPEPISAETAIPLEPDARRSPALAPASAPPATDISEAPEISVHELSADDEVHDGDEPPASSRRPIAIDPKLEELAFGETPPVEGAPHSAPPESGRQVAASPVDLDFEGEFTGVRPRETEAVAVTVIAEAAPVEVVNLAPEATVALLPDVPAATFAGAVAAFKPATFGELLDATLLL